MFIFFELIFEIEGFILRGFCMFIKLLKYDEEEDRKGGEVEVF